MPARGDKRRADDNQLCGSESGAPTDQSLPPDAVLAAAGMSKLQADTALLGWRHWGPGNLPVLLEAKAGLIRLDLQIRSADDITLNIDAFLSYVVLRCAGHKLTSWQLDTKRPGNVYTFTKGQAIWASDGADTWVFHLANTIKQDTEEQSDGIIRAQMNAIVTRSPPRMETKLLQVTGL